MDEPVLLGLCSESIYLKDITQLELSHSCIAGFFSYILVLHFMYTSYPLCDHIPAVGKTGVWTLPNSSNSFKQLY